MVLHFIIAFLSGITVKAVDWIDDEEKGRGILKYPLAILYGLMIGYLISQASFSMLFLAALFAQIFARKIDTHTHAIGFAIAVFTMLFLGFPAFNMMFFAFFLLLAYLDELEGVGRYKRIHEYRPFLKIGSLAFVFIGRIDFFAAIVLFDLGYIGYEIVQKKINKKK